MLNIIAAVLLLVGPPQDTRPLPELKPFLEGLRKTLRTDEALLAQYTYTQRETVVQLDSNGKAKKTEVKVYEVFPGIETTYRRLVSRNGIPLPKKELDKQDTEQRENSESRQRKQQKKSQAELDRERAKEQRETDRSLDDLFAGYDIRLLQRDIVGGHSTVVLSFAPRAGYKPRTKDGSIMQHFAGRAWVSEDDHQLVRIEAEVIKSLSFGLGLLAKLHKGARAAVERRKFNNEVWLPYRVDAEISGRLMLLKGVNQRQTVEYSDHKKYSVETIIKNPGEGFRR